MSSLLVTSSFFIGQEELPIIQLTRSTIYYHMWTSKKLQQFDTFLSRRRSFQLQEEFYCCHVPKFHSTLRKLLQTSILSYRKQDENSSNLQFFKTTTTTTTTFSAQHAV
jgi:uncharacterized membrane protein